MLSHASERSLSRMGRSVEQRHLCELRFRITKRPGQLAWYVKQGTNGCEKWVVKYEEEFWYLVFDPRKKWIVTVLDRPTPNLLARLNLNH